MILFEKELEELKLCNKPYQVEINDLDDLDYFIQNRFEDAYYIMEGILYHKRESNIINFFDEYTYEGIRKEAFNYFKFDNNTKQKRK